MQLTYVDIIQLHVDIIILDVNINELHVDIIYLLKVKWQQYATIGKCYWCEIKKIIEIKMNNVIFTICSSLNKMALKKLNEIFDATAFLRRYNLTEVLKVLLK